VTVYNVLTELLSAVLVVVSLLLLLARSERTGAVRATIVRAFARAAGGDLGWLRWWHVTIVVAVGVGAVMGFDLATGLYGCGAAGAPSDLGGFLAQGRALWSGGNPFNVPDCGGTILEPDGLAAVLLNALGSLGGLTGVAVVWGAVAVALVPLAWRVAGPDRRYLTLVVATSPLYFPVVAGQVDGASNALVPLTVLLTLLLATRGELVATGLAGFFATQRFPTLFPVLALSGSFRRRWAAVFALVAVFAAGTGACYLVWREEFLGPVFFDQFNRASFSLNAWGILVLAGRFPSGIVVTVVQAVATLALVAAVFFTVRSPLRAAAITVTGVALLTQFLSFGILVWLLPVVLVGARPRWWFWGVAAVGSLNYEYALSQLAWTQGVVWPSELLDLLLTALLVGLFVELCRSDDPSPVEPLPTLGDRPPTPARIKSRKEVQPPDADPTGTRAIDESSSLAPVP
jgi:hypothetical protein